jgi:hypothetical protein
MMDEEVVVICFTISLLLRNSPRSEETHTESHDSDSPTFSFCEHVLGRQSWMILPSGPAAIMHEFAYWRKLTASRRLSGDRIDSEFCRPTLVVLITKVALLHVVLACPCRTATETVVQTRGEVARFPASRL